MNTLPSPQLNTESETTVPATPKRDYGWIWWLLIMVVLPLGCSVYNSANNDGTPRRNSVSDEDLYGCSYTDQYIYGGC